MATAAVRAFFAAERWKESVLNGHTLIHRWCCKLPIICNPTAILLHMLVVLCFWVVSAQQLLQLNKDSSVGVLGTWYAVFQVTLLRLPCSCPCMLHDYQQQNVREHWFVGCFFLWCHFCSHLQRVQTPTSQTLLYL